MTTKPSTEEMRENALAVEYSPVTVAVPSTIGYPGGGVKAILTPTPDASDGYVLTLRSLDEHVKGQP